MRVPRASRWAAAVGINLAVLLFAFGAGWRSPVVPDGQLGPPRPDNAAYDFNEAAKDAREILAINSRALFWILVLGMFSGGGYGLLLLGVNGYAIGSTLAAVQQVSPAAFRYMLSYAPLEFAVFVAVNCAAQMLTCSCLDWFRERPGRDARRALAVVACALPLLMVAAGLEAHAIQRYRSTIE